MKSKQNETVKAKLTESENRLDWWLSKIGSGEVGEVSGGVKEGENKNIKNLNKDKDNHPGDVFN